MAAGANRSAGAHGGHGQPRCAARLDTASGGTRSRGTAARFPHDSVDARCELGLGNNLSGPADLRVPGSPLLVEQPRIRVDYVDPPFPSYDQPGDVAG